MEDPGCGLPDTAMEHPESASLQAAMDFPVTASLGPMGPLLRQLQSWPKGVEDDKIQFLKDDIGELCISLVDLSESKDAGFTAKWWMKEVRELCYDTEDYLGEVLKQKQSRAGARRSARLSTIFRVGSKLEWRPQAQIRKKAQGRLRQIFTKRRNQKPQPRKIVTSFLELMARAEVLDDVTERFNPGVSHLTPRLPHQLPVSPTPISVHRDAGGSRLVGVEETMNKLANLLAFDDDNQKQLKVVSILGFPGVGKTTVATTLYHNFRGKFQCRAFVRVSRTPDMIMILSSILKQTKAPQVRAFPDAQDLIDTIREHLQGKRYIIVIDDLWTTSAWNIISRAFPDDECSSRIVTTTGIEDISLACCGYHLTNIFQMSPLSYIQSRELFFARVFGSEDGCPPNFREVSYEIIKKCGGSPLATVCAASLLAWEPNLGFEQWDYIQDSLSSIVSTYSTSEGMKAVLNIIYNDLPTDMQTCLLHLGMYPEGYTIGKDDLVKQWVAERFLNSEKIAGAYFDELVSRGIVQAVDTNYTGEVLFCTVHQMVLDFIRDKSMQENFAISVDYFQSTLALPDKVRRLSIQFGGAKSAKIPEGIIVSQARTLLFSGFFKCVPSIVYYELLRILVLHIWADEDKTFDLTGIRELFHLTYLNIQCNVTIKLPAKIQGLQYLGTMEVDARLSAVPSDIVHLEKLLHLRLSSESNLPHGVGRLVSLRTLGYFDIGGNSLDNVMDLGKLTNLQDLQLTCSTLQPVENLEKNMQLLGSILEKLSVLQSVTLVHTADSDVTDQQDEARTSSTSISCDSLSCVSHVPALLERIELLPRIFIFPSLPKWFGQLGRLRILKIAVRTIWREGIDILKALPALTALSLYVQTAPSEKIVFDKAGFLVLRYLNFRCSVPRLKFEAGAMSNLLKLKLSFNAARVEQQDTPTISIEHLSALKEISINYGGAGADAESALTVIISNHERNPRINVQLVDWFSYGHPSMVTKEKQHIAQDNDEVKEKEKTNDIRNISSMANKVAGKSDKPCKLSHEFIKQITNNYDEALLIGTGASGRVYKGIYEDGKEIAVKVFMNMTGIDNKEFQKEFENLSRLKHPNVVQLVGFCNEVEQVLVEYNGNHLVADQMHTVLCFEYVRNGSLDKYIPEVGCSGLNWHMIYKIIKGICQGLEYLRHGLEYSVWHLDLKPTNVLLGNDMIPKIADFGLSRLFGDENTRTTNSAMGTRGYMPPEYIEHGIITKQYDIFSLGVIIAKLMAGREDYIKIDSMTGEIFIKHVHANWRRKLRETLPPRQLEVYCEQVKLCIQIAVECMSRNRQERPTIESILHNLIEIEKLIELELQIEPLGGGEPILREGDIPTTQETSADASGGKTKEGKADTVSTILKEHPFKLLKKITTVFSDDRIIHGPGALGTLYKGILEDCEEGKPDTMSTVLKELPLELLKKITNDFSDERILGPGSLGSVHKGILEDGEVIAVKKFPKKNLGLLRQTFIHEVGTIAVLKHENAVRLVGFCLEAAMRVEEYDGGYIAADVTERLLCYEYFPKGSLQENLYEESSSIDWDTRFKIIKGICQGLLFLNSNGIVHLNLHPGNVLLDNNMRPKIADYVNSRLLGGEQSWKDTICYVGSPGYMDPNYMYRGGISSKTDIYSLGLIILEISTGQKKCPNIDTNSARSFVDSVRENWTVECIALEYPSLDEDSLDQIRACINIGLECVDLDQIKRPSIIDIVDMLNKILQQGSSSLLSLQARQMNFLMGPKRLTSSSLCLKNSTNNHVAFRLATSCKIPRMYLTKLPFCGIVPPKCAYTHTVIMREQKRHQGSAGENNFLTVQSSIARNEDLEDVNPASVAMFLDTSAADEVQEAKVGVDCESLAGTIPDQIIEGLKYREVLSIDVHATDPWILTSNKQGYVCIWNYETQEEVDSVEVCREPVSSAKFIERQGWCVVGSNDGYIYVYDYITMEEADMIEAHDIGCITSLAVNPSHSFVLSASDDHTIKLWDWTNGWHCVRTFAGHDDTVTQVMFDPRNSESFASSSLDHTVKIWNIHSGTCNITWDGHPDGLLCVHYHPRYFQQLLVAGSSDGVAKVWDLETDSCVDTLQEHAKGVTALCWHPELRVLVTGSLDGTMRIWHLDSTSDTYRLENIIGLNLGAINALGYLKGSTRIVVGCDQGIALMEINVL